MIVERLDPECPDDPGNRALHLERYRWAAERVQGRVLDAACGVGYGAALLGARPGVSVHGIDRDPGAIETARARYGAHHVSFARVEDVATFQSAERFDALVSLETLEHLAEPVSFLRRAHALLRPAGRLVVSAPVRERPGDNPYHLHCFRQETLRAVVREGFEVEDTLSQAGGAYLTLAARRRDVPVAAWEEADVAAARATILLVTWNEPQAVLDLVSAVRALTAPPYRLLVADNASEQETRSLLRLWRGEPGYTLIENQENLRCAAATNQGLALATTPYVVYLCATHALPTSEGWLARLVEFMDERPEVGLAGDLWRPGFAVPSRRYARGWSPEPWLSDLVHVQGGAYVARRALFAEVGDFDCDERPQGGMDVELSYRVQSLGLGRRLARCPWIHAPREPEVPGLGPDVAVVHPASAAVRAALRRKLDPSLASAAEEPEGWSSCGARAVPLAGWRTLRGRVERLGAARAFRVTSERPEDAGLVSPDRRRDVRIRARLRYRGRVLLKARMPAASPDSDGYHVLLGPGTNYLARNGQVLAWFPPERVGQGATDAIFELRGRRLTVYLDGHRVADVEDGRFSEGHVLVGCSGGAVDVVELDVSPLDPPPAAAPPADAERRAAVVFCERLDNESFCAAVVRELEARYEVRACGPGWPATRLSDVDPSGAAFYLELDAASGAFVRPEGLGRLSLPKFAWLVDTHKKPDLHRQIARDVDLSFVAHRSWGHVLDRPWAWLPLHADVEVFRPVEAERDLDLVFVGSQTWRAEPLARLARRHGLRVHVTTTTGPREKSESAAIYARTKLVFNKHVTNDLNFRVFEALCCGRVLLTDAQPNGQYELFEDERHYVLYKDERDLERQVLRLLADDGLRARIEREAAVEAQARHSTRARVGQLLESIETALAERQERADAGASLVVHTPGPRASTTRPRRVLVVAGDEPAAVELASPAERHARELATAGHRVVVVRRKRGIAARAACARSRDAGPFVIELDPGPLPEALTAENALLALAGPAQRELDRIVRDGEGGPFDVVVAEGALGQLTGPPLAQRHGLPLVLLLEGCEVASRGNRLTREQLRAAELEHWACERASAVVVPAAEAVEAVRAHYQVEGAEVVSCPPTRSPRPFAEDVERFLVRVGLSRPFVLLFGAVEQREVDRAGCAVVATAERTHLLRPAGRAAVLGAGLCGPALGALLAAAATVVVRRAGPAAVADARQLGEHVTLVAEERPGWLERALAVANVEPPAEARGIGAADAARGPTARARAGGRKPAMTSYSSVVMAHFWNPKNQRVMEHADALGVAGVRGAGPFLELYLRLDGGRVVEASFQTHGCAASIAAGSLLASELPGTELSAAVARWSEVAVNEALGGLPDWKRHCSFLAAEALRLAAASRGSDLAPSQPAG